MKINNRYSMPFEIAPKSVKINNFIDQPFKSPESTKLTTLESTATRHSNKDEQPSQRNSFGLKVSGFEEQHSKAVKVSKLVFEKKRLSDGVLKADDRYKIEDEVFKEIYERKEKTIRKGTNVSNTTNTSTNSVNTNLKKANAFNSNHSSQSPQSTQRKSIGGSKNASMVSDKSELYSSPAHAQ
jgi:hypothetical protein